MAPIKKEVQKNGGKRKETITLNIKKEMIEKRDGGMRVADIARFYNKSTSTICTILKKNDEIMGLNSAKGVTKIPKQQPHVLKDVEKLLLAWINETQLACDAVTENIICERAKTLYTELISKLPSTSTENEESFKASRGWFDNFRRRNGIYSFKRHSKAESFDAKATEMCLEKTVDLEVNVDGVQEFKEEQSQELTTIKQQVKVEVTPDEGGKDTEDSLTLNKIKEMCRMWETVQHFIENHHPNKAVAMQAVNQFNDIAMLHFYEILLWRQ